MLSAVRRTIPNAVIVGCSATGVLTGAEEVENATAVAVLALGGQPLPKPLFIPGVRAEPRIAGARLGREALALLGGDATGAAVAVLVDPAELDATDFVAGIADAAPDLIITGAGASGGESGCRVFWQDAAQADACVALVIPRDLHPSLGMTQGCQALGDPLTITAAEGNLILEIEGRPAIEALERALSNPRHPGLCEGEFSISSPSPADPEKPWWRIHSACRVETRLDARPVRGGHLDSPKSHAPPPDPSPCPPNQKARLANANRAFLHIQVQAHPMPSTRRVLQLILAHDLFHLVFQMEFEFFQTMFFHFFLRR